jgi:predicted PurR-regulated permease PerM
MKGRGTNAADELPQRSAEGASNDLPQNGTPPLTQRVQVEVTWGSILRLLVAVLLAYAAFLLWPIFKLLVLAILIAVAVYPIVRWAERRGLPRWAGVVLASAALLVVVVGFFAIIAPMVFHQMDALAESLPGLRDKIIAQLPPSGGVRQALEKSINSATVGDYRIVLERTLAVVQTTLGGLVNFVVVIAFSIYLIVDGPRALKWLIVFFPISEREKISRALHEISRLVSSYVGGQFLVSALCATYLFLILRILGVPMALLLGIIAGICDVVPVLGFFIAVFLAMAMGLTVSPSTAGLVFLLYGPYHLFEYFFIVPNVYGKRLKLSILAVPLAIVAGGTLGGIVGAIAALPIVAAYPVVERYWLAPKLAPDTVKEHEGSAR